MRNRKGNRRIIVRGVEFRWRATGNDVYISVGIWPADNIGPYIKGHFHYHETWLFIGNGESCSAGDQIVITNRIIRRVIEHAMVAHGYAPGVCGKVLNLGRLDNAVDWGDAVRAC